MYPEQALYVSDSRPKRLLQDHIPLFVGLQVIIDLVIVIVVLYGVISGYEETFTKTHSLLAVITILLMRSVYLNNGVYRCCTGYLKCLLKLTKSWLSVLGILMIIGYLTENLEAVSQQVLMTWAGLAFAAQVATYIITNQIVKRYQKYILSKEGSLHVLVIGTNRLANHLTKKINNNDWLRDHVVGVIDPCDEQGHQNWDVKDVPILGNLDDLPWIVNRYKIKKVYIALSMNHVQDLNSINLTLLNENINVIWAPDVFGLTLLNLNVKEIAGVPLISLSESPINGFQALIKSAMDRSLALIALVMMSPVFLFTAIAIKISSPGPIFFHQERHGWEGKVITVWKFRSMYLHKEDGCKQATKVDARVTPIGHFIRKTSIDELPQLFNVLIGNMALVGPRPHAVEHNNYYHKKINVYLARHQIKPGITGLAQTNGCRGETKTIEQMQKRVNYDFAYINNWSIWLDIKILMKTFFILFTDDVY